MSITVTLSPQASEIVQRRVKSGEFASVQAVIDAALLGSSMSEIETWLTDVVEPTYDAVAARTMPTYSKDEVSLHLAKVTSDFVAKTNAA